MVEREDSLEAYRIPVVSFRGDRVDSVLGKGSYGWHVPLLKEWAGTFYLQDRPETVFLRQELSASTEMVALGCRVLSGSFEEVAAAITGLSLTEKLWPAQLFGRIDVCRREVCHIQKWRQLLYTVGAVVEDCRGKSNLHYDFISPCVGGGL